ncbi:ATP-dependent DNA helicase [Venturia inaequalis]|nr:ATP-dependent DNA helicase [Venturia inaequalis]
MHQDVARGKALLTVQTPRVTLGWSASATCSGYQRASVQYIPENKHIVIGGATTPERRARVWNKGRGQSSSHKAGEIIRGQPAVRALVDGAEVGRGCRRSSACACAYACACACL